MKRIHPRRLGVIVIVLTALAALIAVTLAVTSGAGASPVATRGFPSGPGEPGIFTERCRFSHEAADDPILMPGLTGQAMHHDFFGNVTTDASSTAATLRGRPTTCATSADSSAYWTPVLYQDGRPLTPVRALIYWLRPRREHAAVHTVPAGLQMIAGDETATAPQSLRVVGWSCVTPRDARAPRRTDTPHSCPAGHDLKLTIFFPSCWDGHTLQARSRDNVVYPLPRGGGCPRSHPVLIPEIVFHVVYPTSSPHDLALSMSATMTGSTDTAHADFINGWKQGILSGDVAACLATSTRCGPVRGPEAAPQGAQTSLSAARRARADRR